MKTIQKEIICRVGQDWMSGGLFIGELMNLHEEIAYLVCQELNITPKELHEKTCVIKEFGKRSITGENHLAEKLLKMKIVVVVGECELIDDVEQKENSPH